MVFPAGIDTDMFCSEGFSSELYLKVNLWKRILFLSSLKGIVPLGSDLLVQLESEKKFCFEIHPKL